MICRGRIPKTMAVKTPFCPLREKRDRRGRKEITMMHLNIKAVLVLIPWNPN